MTKLRLAAAGIALTLLVLPAAAAAAGEVRGVDASSYPNIRATVVTSKVSRTAPIVTENGRPVVGVTAATLANGTSTVLAIDRSQSMKGKPLAQAVAAARAFVQARPAGDRIAVALSALSAIRVDPQQGTTLYDDLVLASQKQSHSPFAGRVTIIVTDGNETSSTSTRSAL